MKRYKANPVEYFRKRIQEVIDTSMMLQEGVYDPGILKCIFMAGGPGSGKSHVAAELFGIDKDLKMGLSSFGLKVVNNDPAFETMLKRNGINPKDLATIEKENPEMFASITGDDGIRGQAKKITKKMQSFYEEGRLGMIVDGTGEDYSSIQKKMKHAEELGYDCYMVFVNTTLEVALENNRQRSRTLPDQLVKDIWQNCQQNLGKFQGLFGADRMAIVDNTERKPVIGYMKKFVEKFIREPLRNPIGKEWVETQLKLKRAGAI